MNIINNSATVQQQLPPLIKESATYKLFVPAKVEEKIRYLIRKFPHTEWSGVLFYKHTGSFENNDLEIHCEDIYPMDLGTSGWTEFKMTEDVTSYIAENLDLFDCETGLVHSHHDLGAFFSGQDTKTLQLEGNDTNCFVSLIVDTRGTYVAAITRKIQKKIEVVTKSLGTSYEFFGEGEVRTDEDPMSESTKVVDKEAIEYFMLDVEREEVDNPLEYLDYRFNEIERKKEESKKTLPANSFVMESPYDKEDNFYDWMHSERKKSAEAKEEVFPSPKVYERGFFEEEKDTDTYSWIPDPTIIHHLAAQLVTSSLIVSKDIDLKQWITRHMKKKYDEIFIGAEFELWADNMVEFIVNHYNDPAIPPEVNEDSDFLMTSVSEAIADELGEYPSNEYLDTYIQLLMNRAYE